MSCWLKAEPGKIDIEGKKERREDQDEDEEELEERRKPENKSLTGAHEEMHFKEWRGVACVKG